MSFSKNIMELRYSWDIDGRKETWEEIAIRVANAVFSVIEFPQRDELRNEMIEVISKRKFIPGGRFLAQSGKQYHQVQNCFLARAEDSREGWGSLMEKSARMLMSGGGLGVDYSDIRHNGAILKRTGGTSSGPIPLMKTINEIGRGVMAGGSRRSAIWSGLRWNHPDVMDFIHVKDWIPDLKKIKEKNFDFPAPMDMTNISVILDKDFFDAYNDVNSLKHSWAHEVYDMVIKQMVTTAEPGFSVDYNNKNESLRNA